MDKIIKLPTHDRTDNYLEQLEGHKYVMRTPYNYMRQGFLDEDTYFIDPSGGPMLIVGAPLAGHEEYLIRSIHFKKHVGFIVTLKEKE